MNVVDGKMKSVTSVATLGPFVGHESCESLTLYYMLDQGRPPRMQSWQRKVWLVIPKPKNVMIMEKGGKR